MQAHPLTPFAGPAAIVDISPFDVRERLAAAVSHFAVRFTEGAVTNRTHEVVIDALQAVAGVASVGIHTDPETGSVDANVELRDGQCVTVHVGDDVIGALARKLDAYGVHGIAREFADRDAKIAALEERLASTDSRLQTQVTVAQITANNALAAAHS